MCRKNPNGRRCQNRLSLGRYKVNRRYIADNAEKKIEATHARIAELEEAREERVRIKQTGSKEELDKHISAYGSGKTLSKSIFNEKDRAQRAEARLEKALSEIREAEEQARKHDEENRAAAPHMSFESVEQVKAEAKSIKEEMDKITSISNTSGWSDRNKAAKALGYESVSAFYAHQEARSTKVGTWVMDEAEKEVGLTQEEIDGWRELSINYQENNLNALQDKILSLREKYADTYAFEEAISGIKAKNRKNEAYVAFSVKKYGYSEEDYQRMKEAHTKNASKFRKEQKQIQEEHDPRAEHPEVNKRLYQLETAYLSKLKEIREFGGEPKAELKATSHQAILNKINDVYPSDWVKAHNEYPQGMSIGITKARAHYRSTTERSAGHMTIRANREKEGIAKYDQVGRHEMAHRYQEVVPGISEMEQAFKSRRETDENGNRRELMNINGKRGENGGDGDYVSDYVGRDYYIAEARDDRKYLPTEVMSVGVEAVFGRGFGSLLKRGNYKGDSDHKAFTLGVLATA